MVCSPAVQDVLNDLETGERDLESLLICGCFVCLDALEIVARNLRHNFVLKCHDVEDLRAGKL